jgi:SAM-dependent methyltransferase
MIRKLSVRELTDLTSRDVPRIRAYDKDEMAIPSYLHRNPLIRWLMWKRYELIADLANLSKDVTALEFGCGIGVFLPELDRRCTKVYALDRFPEYAKSLSAQLDLHVTFVDQLADVPAHSLDRIIAADVLEHIEELNPYLTLFLEKLKPATGRLIVSGPTENPLYKMGRLAAGFWGKGDYHVTNINKLIVEIEKGGFALVQMRTLPFRCPPHLFKVCEFQPLTVTTPQPKPSAR